MYHINDKVPSYRFYQNNKEEFLETMKTIVEKFGVPGNIYTDTGKAIVIMANNIITAIPKDAIPRDVSTEFKVTGISGEIRVTLEFNKAQEKEFKKEFDNMEKIFNYQYNPSLIKKVMDLIKD